MRVKNVDQYRIQLQKLVRDLRVETASVQEQTKIPAGGEPDVGVSKMQMHIADNGTDVLLRETNSALLENEQHLLHEVQSALGRIDDGHFGHCECCHEPINSARLRVVPYARYCIHCAFELESKLDDHSSLYEERRGDEDGHDRDTIPMSRDRVGDRHAMGIHCGGTALGGLSGTNVGHGEPDHQELERATASGDFDAHDRLDYDDEEEFDVAERETHDLRSILAGRHDDDLWERKIRRRRKRYE